jgi:N-methylhydantoinase B
VTRRVDPIVLSVLANSLEGVAREMTNGLLRSGRSSVLNTARDFSCSLLTAGNELLASAEGLPIHVFGSEMLGAAMTTLQPDLAPGDAFLHNDPYRGNSHAADHSILVPIFFGGRHVLTAVAKAHQADCGNAIATTYSPTARDQYEEGALIFPCVRIQRDYSDVEDIVRMCRSRIRVPDQWYGDYLATLGAARIAERRVQELFTRYGAEAFDEFVEAWFDYSERRMASVISGLPACTLTGETTHDPFPGTGPEGLTLTATITITPEAGEIVVDLRDNPDNQPSGLNLTEATATAAALTGVLSALPEEVPTNAGTFRRLRVLLREGCIAGIPRFPHSCSLATTNVADRVVSLVQAAFAEVGEGFGMGEGAGGLAPAKGVVSGVDPRTAQPFVNQLILGAAGGPASAHVDGWPTYQRPVAGALIYHDSAEIDEQRYPILVTERRLVPDSGGPGRHRGGQASRVTIAPRDCEIRLSYALDGRLNPPRGVRGGAAGTPAGAWLDRGDGADVTPAPPVAALTMAPGTRIISLSPGGGGYGDPRERDPAAVLDDVLEGRVSPAAARDTYAVVVTNGVLEAAATAALRRGD